jgi:hypothetical protein
MARAVTQAIAPPGRRRRGTQLIAGALGLALIGLAAAALAPGSPSNVPVAVHDYATHIHSRDPLGILAKHVFDSNVPANVYGTQIAAMENQGANLQGQLISELPPIAPSAFNRPEDRYRAYAERWSRRDAGAVSMLETALRGGSRAGAESAWETAWSDYLRLGAVYGLIGPLDRAIDGVPGEVGVAPSRFSGYHRIEMGLWSGAPLSSLEPWAQRLARDVAKLPHAIATATITPLDYATRSHEILEDAQRDLMSGLDVPWSGEGVLGTVAGLAATREVLATLSGLLQGRNGAMSASQAGLNLLRAALAKVRSQHGGRWPSLGELTIAQRELLDGRLAGALGGLEQLPGALETTQVKSIPRIP